MVVENKYFINVSDVDDIDIYAICQRYGVVNPAIPHAVKKLLVAGKRGYKDNIQDLEEASVAILRAIELEKEWREFVLRKYTILNVENT